VALPGPGLSVDGGAHRPLLREIALSSVDKMAPVVTDAQVIAAAVAAAEPEIRREFLAIIAQLRSERSLAELAGLIRTHRVLDVVGDARAAGAQLAEVISTIYLDAARKIAAHLTAKTGSFIAFDIANPRAIAEVKRMAAQWVTEITDQQRQIVIDIVSEGVRAGVNPRTSARQIRDSVGLTMRQHEHAKNYRRALEQLDSGALERALRDRRFDRTVARAIADGKPLTRKQIDSMVTRYRQRYVKYRAEVIARTEAIGAVHRGQQEAWAQAVDRGDIEAGLVVQQWVTAKDTRTRDSHRSMSGQKRAWGEPFTTGAGYSIRYPHDGDAPSSETISCRCARTIRLARKPSAADA